jgi:ParB family transcriptional regulator, chromosome partitioning protein
MSRKVLGRGLDALFSNISDTDDRDYERTPARRIISVPLNDIIPNRNQPREQFDEDAMAELKASIAENGILEPPIVRRKGQFFELIAGERRFRAARELKFETIDVIVMEVESEDKMLVLSLIENIQRENLNAIEEAKAYQRITETMGLTQEELSGVVGKNRSTIANTLRLLALSERVQEMVSDGTLAPGSARALVTVEDSRLQYNLARTVAEQGLSTRKTEALVKQALTAAPPKEHVPTPLPADLEQARIDMQHKLGTEVRIKGSASKGKIEIPYYSPSDLNRILESIRGDGIS